MRNKTNSSKGNQFKYPEDGTWYKCDFLGYKAASEYLASKILEHTNIVNFVSYDLTTVNYKGNECVVCTSKDFLKNGQRLITSERLFKTIENIYGHEIAQRISSIYEHQLYMYQEMYVPEITNKWDWTKEDISYENIEL